jgi:chromosome segregation ATPase
MGKTEIGQIINGVVGVLGPRLEKIDARLQEFGIRLQEFEVHLKELDTRLDVLDSDMKDLKRRMVTIEDSMDKLISNQELVQMAAVSNLHDINRLKRRVEALSPA